MALSFRGTQIFLFREAEEMKKFELIVSNVGLVYQGDQRKQALSMFELYVSYTQQGYGTVNGESVTLMDGGDVAKEYPPKRR
jgi:hypothetical protein